MTLETRSRRITLLFCVSKATFSMAKACCTAVTMELKSCGLVASGRCSSMATVGSRSVRFCGVSLTTRKTRLVSGTMKAAGGGFEAVQGVAVVRVRHLETEAGARLKVVVEDAIEAEGLWRLFRTTPWRRRAGRSPGVRLVPRVRRGEGVCGLRRGRRRWRSGRGGAAGCRRCCRWRRRGRRRRASLWLRARRACVRPGCAASRSCSAGTWRPPGNRADRLRPCGRRVPPGGP